MSRFLLVLNYELVYPFSYLVDNFSLPLLVAVDGYPPPTFEAVKVVNVVCFSLTLLIFSDRDVVDLADLVEVV